MAGGIDTFRAEGEVTGFITIGSQNLCGVSVKVDRGLHVVYVLISFGHA